MIFLKLKTKVIHWLLQISFNLQNYPITHSEETLVNLVRGRECFVGLSKLLVYAAQVTVLQYYTSKSYYLAPIRCLFGANEHTCSYISSDSLKEL